MNRHMLFLNAFLALLHFSIQENLKCLVCGQVVAGILTAIRKEDPRKTIQVGSFRIEPDGSQKQSQIKYAGSELHLNEILETVCDMLDDFAQAKNKETGALALINLSEGVDKLSTHELISDPDLNRGLKYYCESFVEDHDEDIISLFKKSPDISTEESITKLCSHSAGYCSSDKHIEL
ncbi:protein canopy homolog 1-like [Uloborus diversus]|uniref:protein canopy homolog 1-like n=1 Tax=Uloborus diversus TaxID=327109 RepID=UPI002409E44D|nr:protein canopy homolog 1-like [Uloborus diversus]